MNLLVNVAAVLLYIFVVLPLVFTVTVVPMSWLFVRVHWSAAIAYAVVVYFATLLPVRSRPLKGDDAR